MHTKNKSDFGYGYFETQEESTPASAKLSVKSASEASLATGVDNGGQPEEETSSDELAVLAVALQPFF